MQPTPVDAPAIEQFLATVAVADGHPPLSGHKLDTVDRKQGRVGAWSDREGICLVGVAAHHAGDRHWAVEAALAPRHRDPAAEDGAILSSVALVPEGARHTLWAFRARQVEAGNRLGYVETRSVLRMSGPMGQVVPMSASGVSIARMRQADVEAIVEINNRAFVDHPEQAAMTVDGFGVMSDSEWFDADGVVVARNASGIAGFCVARPDLGGIGEVYLLAVSPDVAGSGYGSMLASAGLEWLARHGATTAVAWVDGTNHAAIRLYRKLGLAEDFRNRELTPVPGR